MSKKQNIYCAKCFSMLNYDIEVLNINPLSLLWCKKCEQWVYKDKVVIRTR